MSNTPAAYFSGRFKSGTTDIWHQRLGHPQASAISILSNKKLIVVRSSLKSKQLCDSCQLGKLSKFPLCSSKHSSLVTFDKIHCDLWSLAFVLSIGKFKFYTCLVDDFSKFTWIIPLKYKYNFFFYGLLSF